MERRELIEALEMALEMVEQYQYEIRNRGGLKGFREGAWFHERAKSLATIYENATGDDRFIRHLTHGQR